MKNKVKLDSYSPTEWVNYGHNPNTSEITSCTPIDGNVLEIMVSKIEVDDTLNYKEGYMVKFTVGHEDIYFTVLQNIKSKPVGQFSDTLLVEDQLSSEYLVEIYDRNDKISKFYRMNLIDIQPQEEDSWPKIVDGEIISDKTEQVEEFVDPDIVGELDIDKVHIVDPLNVEF